MRLEFYHVGQRIFSTHCDVLPASGCSLVFPIETSVLGIPMGDLATATVDAAQPPLEFDFSGPEGVVTRLAIRDIARLVPE